MARRALDRTLLVASAGAMLLSMAPTVAGAWMERLSGTMGAYSPVSRIVILETPRERGGSAARGAQGSALLLVLSGVIVGILLGLLLGSCVLQRWHGRQRRQRDIDRLTEEFQALFRKSDQGGVTTSLVVTRQTRFPSILASSAWEHPSSRVLSL